MTMHETLELVTGWAETSIGDLVTANASLLSRWPFILVTSLDSDTRPVRLAVAQPLEIPVGEVESLGEGLLISGRVLHLRAVQARLFSGFDELWCFDHRPEIPKPVALSIVAPLRLDLDELPPLLSPWMRESRCQIGLGDGVGLNYAASSQGWNLLQEGLSGTQRG